jgi:hypothetical protein
VQPTGAPKLQRRTPIFMDERAKEMRGGKAISCACKCKWETNALSKIILTLLYYAFITERLSLFYFGKRCLLDQAGTGHQKSLAEKAKPVLKRAYARTKTGTRSKTGSARTSTGILLIRVLPYVRITLIFSRIISFMSFTVLLSHMYFFRRISDSQFTS